MENIRIPGSHASPLVLSGLAVDDAVVPIAERSISTMPRITMLARIFTSAALLIATSLSSGLPAQGCTSGTFWQRDSLPAVPSSIPTGVSVIQGLCEGESIGVVFEMPAGMPVQKITKVVAPWGAAFGASGFLAALDIEVYDGVSFSGATVNMGQRVFSLTQDANQNMQVASHGLNQFDTSGYNIIVGGQPPVAGVRRFAICFRTDTNFHPSGSCAAGWPANFFTDNSQFQFVCNPSITPQQTSIMQIAGQGWRDAALATVQGLQLCPLFYSGVFAVRCCSEDAFPASYASFGTGCPNSIGTAQLINSVLPRLGQTMIVNVTNMPVGLGLMITGASNQTSTLGFLPADLTAFGLPGCDLRVSLDLTDGIITFGTTGSWSLAIPNQTNLLGSQFYQQAFVFDPPLNSFGGAMSDAAAWQIGN
ncbi:MAG: hypothetical protein ACJAUC_004871 [Planctomycetota bacterium]